MSDPSVFRVTIRGFFGDLGDTARAYLGGSRLERDVSRAAFTQEGTFTYDARLDSFSLRYEVGLHRHDPDMLAEERGLREARLFLDTMGFAYRSLKVSAIKMSAVWEDGDERRTP